MERTNSRGERKGLCFGGILFALIMGAHGGMKTPQKTWNYMIKTNYGSHLQKTGIQKEID